MLGLAAKSDIIGEVQGLSPVDNLAVGVMAVLGTEWRPTHQTLKHDCAQRPPITVKRISVASEDLWGNVVRRAHSGIGHQSSRSSPIINLRAVANGEVDLVNGHGISISWSVRLALEELTVVVLIVPLVEAGRETKIGQLDMATTVEENVVWLDVTVARG